MSDRDTIPSLNMDKKPEGDKNENLKGKTEENVQPIPQEKTEVKNAHAAGDGSMGRNDN